MIVQKYLKKMKIIRSIINCYLKDNLYALQKFKYPNNYTSNYI
jgi:hypothetical protein